MTAKSDVQLVEAAVNGCVESFGELYERYYRAVVAVAYATLGDMHLAEDAAQETFAVACRDMTRLKRKTKFAAWLAGICRNVARQMARTQNALKLAECNGSCDETCDNTMIEAVRRAVWQLPRRDKEAIILRYYDNMPYEQMSAVLGISKQAVNGRLIRAKRKLAKHLKRTDLRGGDT